MQVATIAKRVNNVLRSVPEAAAPFQTSAERARSGCESEYGGMTGTIRPTSFARVISAVHALSPFGADSVFCDIGSGTGRVSLTVAAAFDVRASLGFDVAPLQVLNACTGYARVAHSSKIEKLSPTYFFQHDAFALDTIEPVTHAYAFVAYETIAHHIARLAAASTTVQVLAMVYLHAADVEVSGLVAPADTDVTKLTGLQMGARAYCGVVVPMTPERRARILATEKMIPGSLIEQNLEAQAASASASSSSSSSAEDTESETDKAEAPPPLRGILRNLNAQTLVAADKDGAAFREFSMHDVVRAATESSRNGVKRVRFAL